MTTAILQAAALLAVGVIALAVILEAWDTHKRHERKRLS